MRPLLLLSILWVGLCGQPQPFEPVIDVPLGEPFVLRVDQSAAISGTSLRLRFEAVLEDSRCPADVVCVWQGNARVHLLATTDGEQPTPVDLNTGLEPRSLTVHGYVVRLDEVQPVPASARSIAGNDYLATLRVTSN